MDAAGPIADMGWAWATVAPWLLANGVVALGGACFFRLRNRLGWSPLPISSFGWGILMIITGILLLIDGVWWGAICVYFLQSPFPGAHIFAWTYGFFVSAFLIALALVILALSIYATFVGIPQTRRSLSALQSRSEQ
jgi:hypothetical protein